jgi:hypothetical protein
VREGSAAGPDSLPQVLDGALQLTPRPGWTRTKDIYRNFRLTFAYRPPSGDPQPYISAPDWRFQPTMRDGKPVPMVVAIELAFMLP